MISGWARRWRLAVLVVLFGTLAVQSQAADKAKGSELSAALARVKMFAGLTERERVALESIAALRQGKEGERIIQQGKPLAGMFIILKGPAEVRVNGNLVATLPEQSLVGEVEFLDMLPASADVSIHKDTVLIELDNGALKELMRKRPRLGYVLMSEIAKIEARRLRSMNQKLEPAHPSAPADRK